MANSFALAVSAGGLDTALTGAGTTITDALQLAAQVNVFTTVAASSGAKLFSGSSLGNPVVVRNSSATNALAVYPAIATGVINGGSAGAAFSVTAAKTAIFFPLGGEAWVAVLSA